MPATTQFLIPTPQAYIGTKRSLGLIGCHTSAKAGAWVDINTARIVGALIFEIQDGLYYRKTA
jgi:hypothetical protein